MFENVDLTLFRGEKLAIVGANGVGKTSFIKALTGEIPFSGRVNWGAGVKTGYFEQECRNLVLSNTVYDEVCRHFSLLTPYDVRSLLARVLIFGDDVEKRVGELSGANRSKVALAILMRKRPTSLSWTSLPTTSTTRLWRGWTKRCPTLTARCFWFPTTGFC